MRLRSSSRPPRAFLRALLCAGAVAACSGDGPTGSGSRAPTVTAVSALVPGGTATLTGANLSRIATFQVDGQAVPLSAGTDAERTFQVPSLRPCETDGRPVRLTIDGTDRYEPLRVRDPVRMEVGESRLLSAEELAALRCLQFAAADEDYVLTALHLSYDAADRADTLATFRTWTESSDAPRAAAPGASVRPRAAPALSAHVAAEAALLRDLRGAYAAAPASFDPRYATAGPGDTVRFVDWRQHQNTCSLPRDQVESYPVVVAAVSGSTVIGVDARLPNARRHLTGETLEVYRQAVRIVDSLLLPAMRATFDRGFQPPAGGGGRRWMIVTSTTVAMAGDGGTWLPQAGCPHASEMIATVYPGADPLQAGNGPGVAATFVHEYAHNAYAMTVERLRGFTSSGGWPHEAWPELAIEVAARIALGRPTGARPQALDGTAPFPPLVSYFWGRSRRERSPWGPRGMYNLASSILLHARERRGDADYDAVPSLFRAFVLHPAYATSDAATHLRTLAAAAGTDPVTLLDEWALAHATDDLVDPQAAAARALPQFRTWDNADGTRSFGAPRHEDAPSRLPRTTNVARALVAAPGAYDAAYLMASQGKGISLEVTGAREARYRLTRLR